MTILIIMNETNIKIHNIYSEQNKTIIIEIFFFIVIIVGQHIYYGYLDKCQ